MSAVKLQLLVVLLVLAAQASAQDEPSRAIEEIVVTAEKRSTNLGETPIAISTLDSEQMAAQQVNGATDLQALVPTLVIGESTGETAIAIRGVSHEFNTAGGEAGVALNVDGVPFTQSFVAPMAFHDVRAIEVLRGPQGTLYGRNTTGGAINVSSERPNPDAVEAEATVGLGRFENVDTRGFLSVPLADFGGIRVAGIYVDQDGYMTNLVDGSDQGGGRTIGGRATFELRPMPVLTVTLRADNVKDERDGATIKLLASRAVAGLPVPLGQNRIASDPWELYTDLPGTFDDVEARGASATIEYDVGLFTVRSITADRTNVHAFLYDIDGTDDPESSYRSRTKSSPFTQEVNVFGEAGPLSWLVGAFYLQEDLAANLDVSIATNVLGPFLTFRFEQESRSVAGFGQVTVAVTDWLRLTGGARYTRDEKEVSQRNSFPPLNPCTSGSRFENSWSELTPKAGIDVIPTDDLFLYATFSKGYKAGGFNLTNCGDDFDPETITAYETGVKSFLFDGALSLNLTGFYYDYSAFQANLFIALANEIVNAAEATVKGAELEATWLPWFVDGLTVRANGGWLDAAFDELVAPNSFEPLAGNQNLEGNRIPRAPKFTASAGGSYELTAFDAARLGLHVNHRYSDDFFFDIFNDPVAHQSAYQQTDATVTLASIAEGWLGGWELAGFVKNIENEDVLISAIPTISVFGVIGEYAAPRTYGFRVSKRFG